MSDKVYDVEQRLAALISQGGFVVPPSGDTSGAADVSRINNAAAAGALLGPGPYLVNAPVVVPDGGALLANRPGGWGIPSGNYGAGSLALAGTIIRPVSGFSGTAVVRLPTPGGSQGGNQVLGGFVIDGSQLPAGNSVHGIAAQGYIAGVVMRDIRVWGGYNTGTTAGLGGHGLYADDDGTGGHNPDFWNVQGFKFSACGGYGIRAIALADTTWMNGECTGNATGGIRNSNGADTKFVGVRAASNATTGSTPGWDINGATGFTGRVTFIGCPAENNGVGWAFSGAGTGTWLLAGCFASGNTTQFTYAGSMTLHTPAAWNTSTVSPTFG